jgi:hypothetical protein
MKFGQQLLTKRYSPWADFYLDYEALKKILEDHKRRSSTKDRLTLTTTQQSSSEEENETDDMSIRFVALLEKQVKKIVQFFLKQQGQLATRLEETLDPQLLRLLEASDLLEDLSQSQQLQEQIRLLLDDYTEAGITLLRLVHYIDLNVTGLRKICKKYDKLTGHHLSQTCFRLQNVWNTTLSSNTHGYHNGREPTITPLMLRPLLEDGGVQALYVTIRASLLQLDQLQEDVDRHVHPAVIDRRHTYSNDFHNNEHDNENDETRKIHPGHDQLLTHSERLALNIPALLDQQADLEVSPTHVIVLLKIKAARRKLQKSSDVLRMLAAAAVVLPQGGDEEYDNEMSSLLHDGPLRRRQFSKLLNYASTFLHMLDYYIVTPTAGLYAQRLGQPAALAGMIIGINSVSALGSTVLYSWWSNFSYRQALLFATFCQMAGAIVYACGLPLNSLTLVLVGRFISGFGSARSINRRYIADTFAVQERTAASAGLVSAGSVGTAAGPAIAALLFWLAPNDIHTGSLFWQVENAPGWVMATLWAGFLVLLYMYFEDPPRRGMSKKDTELVESTGEERQLLLNDDKDGRSVESIITDDFSVSDRTPLWRIIPVCTTFFVYFCLKFNIESLWSSTSILTLYQFGWKGSTSGLYLAILGLMVMPANWCVAVASQYLMDRDLMMITQIIMLWGCLAILQFSETHSVVHYLIGTSLIFVAANALEGPNMSLLSKTIPFQYSRGLFNVGLLATESGTLGYVCLGMNLYCTPVLWKRLIF